VAALRWGDPVDLVLAAAAAAAAEGGGGGAGVGPGPAEVVLASDVVGARVPAGTPRTPHLRLIYTSFDGGSSRSLTPWSRAP
jgi:hypothetical protein